MNQITFHSGVKVTEIELNFGVYEDAYPNELLDENYKEQILDDIKNKEWFVVNEDDLIDEIQSWTGWCVESLSYEVGRITGTRVR
jgi:hypothetical protein